MKNINWARIAKKSKLVLRQNSPVILSVVGAIGVVVTAVTATRAGLKTGADIAMDYAENADELGDLTDTQLIKRWTKRSWKYHVPTAVAAVGTIAAIGFSSKISVQRTAAMGAAYSLSERAFREYRDRVVEKVGEKKAEKIDQAHAQERINKNPLTEQIIVLGKGTVLMFDPMSARYFRSSTDDLEKAINKVNFTISHEGYCSLNEFYDYFGVEGIASALGDQIGWNSNQLVESRVSPCISDDSEPALSIGFNYGPFEGYHKSR